MPRRPVIVRLPEPVRQALDERLSAAAYGDHKGTAAWLTSQGYPIGGTAVGNYAKRLFQVHADEGRSGALTLKRCYPLATTRVPHAPVARRSQTDAVLQALIAGRPVNQVTATENGWTLRLAAVIYRLRKKGWPIETSRRRNCGLADYFLTPGAPLPTEPIPQKSPAGRHPREASDLA